MTNNEGSITVKNLEAAFAGESMANRKYLYFAKQCRAMGANDIAEVFEKTAQQETAHAFGHLELLFPPSSLTVDKMLQFAIDGETYEYTEMYPKFRSIAVEEQNSAAVAEMDDQIEESKEHAEMFAKILQTAEKRFSALTKVEKRHAQHYQDALDSNLKK